MLATYMDGLAPQISDSEAVLWELKIEFKAKFGKLPQCRPDEPLSEFQGRIRTVLRDIDPTGLTDPVPILYIPSRLRITPLPTGSRYRPSNSEPADE